MHTLSIENSMSRAPSPRWCWRWRRPGVRRGVRAAGATAAAASATRTPAAPRWPRTRAPCGRIPPACRAFPTIADRGRACNIDHAVDQVQQQRLAGGVQPAARRQRRRRRRAPPACRTCTSSCRSTSSWAFGLGIGAPFGLETEWDDGWLGRYQALQVEDQDDQRQSGDVVASINDQFSVGVGVNWQQIKATFTATPTIRARSRPAAQDGGGRGGLIPPRGSQRVRRCDARTRLERRTSTATTARGAGTSACMWDITPRHATRRPLPLDDQVRRQPATSVSSNPALPLPPGRWRRSARRSRRAVNAQLVERRRHVRHRAAGDRQRLVLHAAQPQVGHDGRRAVHRLVDDPELTFVRTTGAGAEPTPENFKDAWRSSVGANYHLDDKWKFRGGIAWDQTPVNDTDRTPRLPDADRFWLAGRRRNTSGPAAQVRRRLRRTSGRTTRRRTRTPAAPRVSASSRVTTTPA